jgi:plasmid stabilization system protein ParE
MAMVTVSRPAQADLDTVWDYLAETASPAIADFVIARLYEAMHRAADAPLIYQRTDFAGRPRRVNIFEYAIFFEIASNEDGIVVWRVLHGRRNLAPLVRGPDPGED